jgi:hypothetical protein
VVCDGLEKRFPLCRVERVPEVQLQEDVVRDRLLQPHADLVNQTFCATQNAHTDLLGL